LKAIKKSKPDAVADKRKRIEACKGAITEALRTKLGQYPTSIEEDEALLKKGDLEKRPRMAIEVRMGEKMLLQEAKDLMQGGDTSSEEANGERAPKRARTSA
jgi:SET domain-containing protein 6